MSTSNIKGKIKQERLKLNKSNSHISINNFTKLPTKLNNRKISTTENQRNKEVGRQESVDKTPERTKALIMSSQT